MKSINLKNKKKLRNAMFIAFIVFLALTVRIGIIQFINGKELQSMAYEQQVQQRTQLILQKKIKKKWLNN